MANRPVFYILDHPPYYQIIPIDFEYYPGFALSQNQKSIDSLHHHYLSFYPDRKILEISSKSKVQLGIDLSAFNLMIYNSKGSYSVESAYQASKVFENGGPYTDLLYVSSSKAKKDIRLKNSGNIIGFQYFKHFFPNIPNDYFYNYLYLNALVRNQELADQLIQYDSFTDIVFNPKKGINCQAKAAAIYVSLYKTGRLKEALASKESFLKIVYEIPEH